MKNNYERYKAMTQIINPELRAGVREELLWEFGPTEYRRCLRQYEEEFEWPARTVATLEYLMGR